MNKNLRLICGKKIESPKSSNARPTTMMVREAIFNILKKEVANSYWLDLFSGSGSIACEAFNHGAKKIIAIEKDKINARICKNNLFSLNNANHRESDIEVICKDVFNWIKSTKNFSNYSKIIDFKKDKFDFIYLDPPYKKEFQNILLEEIFNSNLIKNNTLVIYEHSKLSNIKDSSLWKLKDIRSYGQTKVSFLIKI